MMLSIPVGVMAGLIFYAIQYDYDWGVSLFWLIFGALLGGFLCHGVMEALYNGDIKKCLSHKLQMVVTMVVAAVIPLIFLFDIFGFDSYLPEKDDITSMAMSSGELRFNGTYYEKDGWTGPVEYALEHMDVEDIDAMYELAEVLTEEAGENRAERFFGRSNYYITAVDSYYVDGIEKVNMMTSFVIRYTLKNGSEVIRRYEYNYYAVMDLLEQIYNDTAYKKVAHPVFSLLEAGGEISYIQCDAPATGVSVMLEKGCQNILEAYAADVLAMSFDDLKTSAPVAELTTHVIVKNGTSSYEDVTSFLLYPEMTRTIALLKEQGYSVHSVQEANISSITITYGGTINELKRMAGMEVTEEDSEVYYDEKAIAYEDYELYYEKFGYYPSTLVASETYQEVQVEFTDPAEIDELKKHLVYRQYGSEFGPFPEITSFVQAAVYFEVGNSSAYEESLLGWTEQFRFRANSIPQFVIERVLEELGAGK